VAKQTWARRRLREGVRALVYRRFYASALRAGDRHRRRWALWLGLSLLVRSRREGQLQAAQAHEARAFHCFMAKMQALEVLKVRVCGRP
jgi:hypothetical protein